MVDDLNLSIGWGELLHKNSSNLRTRLQQMSAMKSGLNKNATLIQETPGTQLSRDQYPSEGSMNQVFGVSHQSFNTLGSNLGSSDVLDAIDVDDPGVNQGNMGVNGSGSAFTWDNLSLWLDPLGPGSAGNVSQMPWHGDQGMYGMLEPFIGGLGEYYYPDT